MGLNSCPDDVSKYFLVVLITTSGLLNIPQATGMNCNPKLTIIPDVEISTSPQTQKLALGTAVNLTCMAQPRSIDAGYFDRWTKYIQWYDPQGKPVGHRCVQGRRMVLKLRCTLMLRKLTAEKLGGYTCEAGNPYRKHCRRKSVEIRPQERSLDSFSSLQSYLQRKDNQNIKIIKHPKSQHVFINSSVILNCAATGQPKPTILWMKNNDSYALQTNKISPRIEEKIILPDNKTVLSQLLLTGTNVEDHGKYHCVANNNIEKRISRVAFLHVADQDHKLSQVSIEPKCSCTASSDLNQSN